MPLAEQLDAPPLLAEKGTSNSKDGCESDQSFNNWLNSLPEDDWSNAIDESVLLDVTWVDGVGFVRQDA